MVIYATITSAAVVPCFLRPCAWHFASSCSNNSKLILNYASACLYAGFQERAEQVNMLQQSNVDLYAQATQQNDSKLFEEAKKARQQIGSAVKDAIDSSNGYAIQPFWGLHQLLILLAPQDAETQGSLLMTPVHQGSLTYDTMVLERGDDVLLCSSRHGVQCLCQLKFKTTDKLLADRRHDLLQSSLYHQDELIKQGSCNELRFVYASLCINHAQKDNPAGQWRDQQSKGFRPSDPIVQTLRAMFKKAFSEEYDEKCQQLQSKSKEKAGSRSDTQKGRQQDSKATLHQATAGQPGVPPSLPSESDWDMRHSSELQHQLDELKTKHQRQLDFLDDDNLFCVYLEHTQLIQLSSWEELREGAVTALFLFICSMCKADVAGLSDHHIQEIAHAVLVDLYFGRVDACLQTGAAHHAHQEAEQTRLRQQSDMVAATDTKADPQARSTAATLDPISAPSTAATPDPISARSTTATPDAISALTTAATPDPISAPSTVATLDPMSAPSTAATPDAISALSTAATPDPISAPVTTATTAVIPSLVITPATAPIPAPTLAGTLPASPTMTPIRVKGMASTPLPTIAANKAATSKAAKVAKAAAAAKKRHKAAAERQAKLAAKELEKRDKAAAKDAANKKKAAAKEATKADKAAAKEAAKENLAAAKAEATAHDVEKRTLTLTEVRSRVVQLVKQIVQGFQGNTEMLRRFQKYQQVCASWTKLTTEIDELGAELYLQVTDPLVEAMQQQPDTEGSERVVKAKMRAHYVSEAHRRAGVMPNANREADHERKAAQKEQASKMAAVLQQALDFVKRADPDREAELRAQLG